MAEHAVVRRRGRHSKAPHTAASATIGKGVWRGGSWGGAMILDGTIPVGGGI